MRVVRRRVLLASLLAVFATLSGCQLPEQHFRGQIIDVDSDILGRYWVATQVESVFNMPAPLRDDCGDGHVVIRFVIDSLGQVVESWVLEAEPENCYEEAALRLVQSWSFHAGPGNRRLTPVRVKQRIPFISD